MYPANIHADIPPCFAAAAIDPTSVNILNNILTPDMIKTNLDKWLQDWESAIATEQASYGTFGIVAISLLAFSVMVITLKKKKKIPQ